MNKSTKIWLNTLAGIAISALLFYSLWLQVNKQLLQLDSTNWWRGDYRFLLAAILLMPLNLATEVFKWKLLSKPAQDLSAWEAWSSYLAGIAISLITPNRIGEYPGRILYLKRKNTIRLISAAILGAFTQFSTLFIFGCFGLIYYNTVFPGYWPKIVLVFCIIMLLILAVIFFRFNKLSGYLNRIKKWRRFQTYGQLMQRFTMQYQLKVLGYSMLRFIIFTVQYLLLLSWMGISLLSFKGFLIASLYFWFIAVIPSIAFAELGVRGQVSIFLFGHFTQHTLGILTATIALWCINLIIPAVAGSILLLRIRLLR